MLILRSVLIVILAVCAECAIALAQAVDTIDPAMKARLDAIAAGVMQQRGMPSASVAVVQGRKLVYAHAYGRANIDPDKAATPEMRYSIGSISKQFTATAILVLQEQGKLKLDDPVGKYVPGLTRGDEVTIRQILSHTSGYPGCELLPTSGPFSRTLHLPWSFRSTKNGDGVLSIVFPFGDH